MDLSLPKYLIRASDSYLSSNKSLRKFPKINVKLLNKNHLIISSSFLQLPLKEKRELGFGGWRVRGIDDGSCGIVPYMPPPPPSASDVVREFYNAINGRDLNKLDQILSDDCHYKDLIFYIPFTGREGVKSFLNSLINAMGPNVHIAIDSMAEGEGLTASVFWHLEWKDKELPFTGGCRFFQCEEVDGRILIRNITGLEEFPLKPGDLVLKLLKAFTTFFDLYPIAAEGLLLKSHANFEGLDKLLDMLRGRRST